MNLGAPSWLVAWLQAVSVWDLLLIAAAVAGVVVFIRRKGWRTVKAMARGILDAAEILVAVQGLPEFIQRTDARLDAIHHETHTNDGSSIKDAVGRVEKGVAGLHGRMDPVEADLSKVKTAVEQLQTSDEEIRAELEQTHPTKESP